MNYLLSLVEEKVDSVPYVQQYIMSIANGDKYDVYTARGRKWGTFMFCITDTKNKWHFSESYTTTQFEGATIDDKIQDIKDAILDEIEKAEEKWAIDSFLKL